MKPGNKLFLMKKKLLIYGAGAIGRGYMPWVFPPSDFDYYFVEQNPRIRNLMSGCRRFQTLRTANGSYQKRYVSPKKCYAPGEERDIIPLVDAIILAVGPRNVLSLSENLKNTSMPVICAENDASIPALLASITKNPNIVFAIPDVITSNTAPAEILKRDPLSIVSEDGVCYIDEKVSYVGGEAEYVSSDDLGREWKAKLYLHNTPHCITAYLGSLVGASYVHEAMQFPKVRAIVAGAMNEMRSVLLKHFKLDPKFVNWYAEKELQRFSNVLLYDPISRVAREPFRKLELNERLIGAAELCLGSGVIPEFIMTGIMSAFYYNNSEDNDANIKYLVRALSPRDFLGIVMKMNVNEALVTLLCDRWERNLKAITDLK